MKKQFLFSLFIFIAQCSIAQPAIEWQKSLGGTKGDVAYSIRQTKDGGFIVAGLTASADGDVSSTHGNDDYWIVKQNSMGVVEWEKTFGGSGDELAYSIEQTTDSGYIIAGYSYSNDGDVSGHHGDSLIGDCWIVKIDQSGTIQWQKSLGGTKYDQASDVKETFDGGYIVAGYTMSSNGDVTGSHGGNDYWIVKLSNSGVIQWQKCLGGTGDDRALAIELTNDSGYIVAGASQSNNGDVTGNHTTTNADYWIVKLNNSGVIQWQKCFGGTGPDAAYAIQQTSDNGYIVVGYSTSRNGDVTKNNNYQDYWIVKLDNLGIIQWQKSLGGSGVDIANSVRQTTDGGYLVGGYTGSNDSDVTGLHGLYNYNDYWIVKLSSGGNLQWQKCLGGSGADNGYSLRQTNDGGYIMAGFSHSTDGDGTNTHGLGDYWIVKLSSDVGVEEQINPFNILQLSPNPCINQLTIHTNLVNNNESIALSIINLLGETMQQEKLKWSGDVILNIKNLPAGIYFLQLKGESGSVVKRFVKE